VNEVFLYSIFTRWL